MSDVHPTQSSRTYYIVFAALMAALIISLILGGFTSNKTIVTTIFAIAAVKAYWVLTQFMHLKLEPRYLKVLVISVLTLLAILYFGLVPDIVWVYGRIGEAP